MPLRKPRKHLRRRGAHAVEFALTAPLLFLFVFTCVEFARMNSIRHTVDNASYEAARVGITPDGTNADVQAAALRIMAAVGARNSTVQTTPTVITPETEEITVTVTTPVADNGFIAPVFFADRELVGQTTLNRETL